MTDFWTETRHDKIAVLTFERPPKNWMSLEAMTQLRDHLERLAEQTAEVSVVMLTGGVDGYFIAHADLDDLARLAKGEKVNGDPHAWSEALTLLETMPQPTVAAIDGQAWGGGCETALACTVRVGSERAHLGQPEVSVGIIPGAGGTQRLTRIIGEAKAKELIIFARRLTAAQALDLGVVNAVGQEDQSALDLALEWVAPLEHAAPIAIAAALEAIDGASDRPLEDGLSLEKRCYERTLASTDRLEALAAFAEKRPPQFKGE
jgi:enoyl-CoA hydratase/carnithine racemase